MIGGKQAMKIQYLNGGLANQVFQYIFVRYAELSGANPMSWFFDDSFFELHNVHNGYELEKVFGLKLNLLSNYFEPEIWQQFIQNKKQGISIPQCFKNLGFDIQMITEFDNYKEHNPFNGTIYHVPANSFLPELTTIEHDFLYFHGYWLNPQWFRSYAPIFKKELSFPAITQEDSVNYEYMLQICNTKSVALHIRRGDYVTLGWDSACSFYAKHVKEILSNYPDANFFVFSDDILWCQRNLLALGLSLPKNVVYITGNDSGRNYRDLQLMSMCKIMLIGKSAFGYLAMLLNEHLEYSILDT